MAGDKMRTNVTFRHPAEFVPLSNEDGILAVAGAQWFATLLSKVSGLKIDEDLCQEDWGVVFFARRNQKKFWIGLSAWDFEGAWLAHFHHGSFAWLQQFSSSGKRELMGLLTDFHEALVREVAVSNIAWHNEREMTQPAPADYPMPVDGPTAIPS